MFSRDSAAHSEPSEAPASRRTRGRLVGVPPLVGVALVVMGAGLAFVASGFERGASARVAGTNAPVNAGARAAADISAHNSPTLVANPRSPANLAVADKIDSPRYSCALNVSFDGGVHWQQTPIPLPAGEEPKCYAPDVAFAADGTLFLSFVTLAGRGNAPHAVWLVRSLDGGQTLSDPRRVQGPLKFQVRLAADPKAPRRLYMTWLDAPEIGLYRFSEPGNPIRAARSDDGGRTWSTPATVNAPARTRVVAPSPVVGPDGDLLVLYLDLGEDELDYAGAHRGQGGPAYDGNWTLVLARSGDRGATWGESVVDDKIVPAERFIVFIPPFPSLAVDRGSGTIYAAFHDARAGDADVYLWRLERGAKRWSAPLKVNDTRGSDESSQLLPKLSVAPDGRLDVLYYDRRTDPADVMTEASLQSSYDGGRSFLARLRLSDRRFDSRFAVGNERGMPELGNRLGLISTRDRALAVWTDTRGGTKASGKSDLARGLAAFHAPEDLSTTTKTLLRVLGILLALTGIALIAYAAGRRARDDESDDADHAPARRRPAPRPRQRV
jgi:hypothetical protein